MLWAILNKSWRQHPTKQQLYSHLPPITKTIQVKRTRHIGHCWRSRDELISDVLLWIPAHGRAKAGRPARTYMQQFCADTGCSLEDLPEAMNDREGWRERVLEICADGVTWWGWWPNGIYTILNPFWRMKGPDLVINNEKERKWENLPSTVDFAVSTDHRVKNKENEKRDKYLDLAIELNKTMKYEDDGDTNCNCCTRNDLQRLGERAERVGNRWTSREHPNYSIVKIAQNTEKCPGNLRWFVVAQTPVKTIR